MPWFDQFAGQDWGGGHIAHKKWDLLVTSSNLPTRGRTGPATNSMSKNLHRPAQMIPISVPSLSKFKLIHAELNEESQVNDFKMILFSTLEYHLFTHVSLNQLTPHGLCFFSLQTFLKYKMMRLVMGPHQLPS